MARLATGLGLGSLLLTGAIFGFFYAWVCSTMWGLDAIDPRVAIHAMQGMNASVRNAVFAPAFFGTPLVLALAAGAARAAGMGRAAGLLAAAGVIYLGGGMILTLVVNVPMNEALARLAVPEDIDEARAIWDGYSPRWQAFNIARTGFSGAALLLTGLALLAMRRG